MKAIFDTRSGSGYDDDVTRRYHFGSRYLAAAERAVGDWIIYREPRRAKGRQGYVAVLPPRSQFARRAWPSVVSAPHKTPI